MKKQTKRVSLAKRTSQDKKMERILVVEDQLNLAKGFQGMLKELGYKVVGWAQTGQAAIQKTKKLKPDLVLMDIMLKGEMNGIDAAKTIKEINVPVLFMTAYPDENKIMEARKTDPFGYIVKPFEKEELEAVIEIALQKKRGEVSQQVKSKGLIQEAHEETSNYLDLVGSIVIVLDTKGKVILINKKGCQVLGYKKNELNGKDWFKTCLPKEYQKDTKNVFRKVATGNFKMGEFWKNEIIRKDGAKRMISWHNSTQKDNKGNIIRILSSGEDITEEREKELALKRSEAEYRTIFENTGTATCIIEADKTISLANGVFSKLSGFKKEEIEGKKKWTEFITPEYQEMMEGYHTKRRKTPNKTPKEYEFDFIDAKGGRQSVLLFIDMIPGTQKSVASMLNVTEEKETAEKLLQSEEKYRSITENAQEMIMVVQDEKLVLSNARLHEVVGYSEKEVKTMKSFVDFVHPEDRQMVAERHQKRMRGEKIPSTYSFRIINKKKEVIWVEINANFIQWEGKVAVLVFMEDITEKREKELELKKFGLGFERSEQVIFTTDLKGRIEYINPQFEKVYGYKKREVIGGTPRLIKSNVRDKKFYEMFWEKLLSKKAFHTEIVNKTKSGKLINISASLSPILNESNELEGFMSIQSDITKQVIAEKTLNEKVEQMEFMGRTNLKRHKQMMELERENKKLKEKIKNQLK